MFEADFQAGLIGYAVRAWRKDQRPPNTERVSSHAAGALEMMRSEPTSRAPAVGWCDWLCTPDLPTKRVRGEAQNVELGGNMKWKVNREPCDVEKADVRFPIMRELAGRARAL